MSSYRMRFQAHGGGINTTIVGTGGTGGFVAEALCRLMIGTPGTIVLVDPDRVEPHNVMRQNFYEHEIGEYKAEALAHRLARAFRRPIDYRTDRFQSNGWRGGYGGAMTSTNVVIGCVDNAQARKEIANAVGERSATWWIDAGNGKDWGQVLLGNHRTDRGYACAFTNEWCYKVPLPTCQVPGLLDPTPPSVTDIDCAAAILLSDQDPTINQTMATATISLFKRLVTGECDVMGVYVDQKRGTMTSQSVTPENIAQMTGADEGELMADHGADERCDRCQPRHF